jgi:hypothetical protein
MEKGDSPVYPETPLESTDFLILYHRGGKLEKEKDRNNTHERNPGTSFDDDKHD